MQTGRAYCHCETSESSQSAHPTAWTEHWTVSSTVPFEISWEER